MFFTIDKQGKKKDIALTCKYFLACRGRTVQVRHGAGRSSERSIETVHIRGDFAVPEESSRKRYLVYWYLLFTHVKSLRLLCNRK